MENNVAQFWNNYNGDLAGDQVSPEIIRLAKKYIGRKVLDIGAGNGALISLLPGSIGIDLAPKNDRVRKGDIINTGFESETFDTIFATEVLEHLSDDILEKGLIEVKRILKKGGFFIIAVPYNEDLKQSSVLCPKCGESFHRWGHLQTFNEEKIKHILEDKGFFLVQAKALPLGSMARHKFLKKIRRFFEIFGYFKPNNLFVVAKNG